MSIKICHIQLLFVCMISFLINCHSFDPEVIHLNDLDESKLPYTFRNRETLSSARYKIYDLNHDEKDEFLIFTNNTKYFQQPNFIILESQHSHYVYFEKIFHSYVSVLDFYPDINDDGWDEILIMEKYPDSTLIHLLDHTGKSIQKFTTAVKPENIDIDWNCSISSVTLMNINGDGIKDVLLNIQSGYAYQPRGIAAWDIITNEYLWYYQTGFVPRNPVLSDIDQDGSREILLGSNSPNNGIEARGSDCLINGTDDAHTYITVLDSSGQLIKQQCIGHAYSRVNIHSHDMNRDSNSEYFITFRSHAHPWEQAFVARWNPEKGIYGHRIERGVNPLEMIHFFDADRDGVDDILLAWDDGTIEIRNQSHEVIRQLKIPDLSVERVVIWDVNRDAEEEIYITGRYMGKQTTVMLNRKLHLLAWLKNASVIRKPVKAGFDQPQYLLARSSDQEASVFSLHLQKRLAPDFFAHWQWVLYGFFIASFIFAISLLVLKKKNHFKNLRRITKLLSGSEVQPIVILNNEGQVRQINTAFRHEFNINKEIRGRHWKQMFKLDQWSGLEEILKKVFNSPGAPFQGELQSFRNNQQEEWMAVGRWVRVSKKEHYCVIRLQNITKLTQSRRAVAWASMAQKLAHEVKTPLSTVMLSAQNIAMDCKDKQLNPEKMENHISRILKQVSRLRELTDAFLKFSHLEPPSIEKIDINKFIQTWIKDHDEHFGDQVETVLSLQPDIPPVSTDPQQFHSVIKNIVDNALNAMKGRGVLTISTRLVQSLPGSYKKHVSQAVQIEITDTGQGISPEDCEKLFQPFFSRSASGTGLGLVICKKIIEDHHGTINVNSEAGTGTTFTISLPLNDL